MKRLDTVLEIRIYHHKNINTQHDNIMFTSTNHKNQVFPTQTKVDFQVPENEEEVKSPS